MCKIFNLFGIIFFASTTIAAKNFTTYQKVDAISPSKTVTGDIYGDGEYYIFNSDLTKSIDVNPSSDKPVEVTRENATSWNITFTDSTFKITKCISDNTYTLAAVDRDAGLRIKPTYSSGTTQEDWTYDRDNQRLSLQFTSYKRYFGYHSTSSWQINANLSNDDVDFKVVIIRKDIYEGFVNDDTKASLKLSYSYEEETFNISNIGLRFGGAITKSLKDNLDLLDKNITYGVKYSYTPEGGCEISSKTTLAKYVTSFGAYEECDKNEANFYQFFMSVNKFPLNQLNTVITARCYILIENDGFNTEYLMKEKAYSVKEMCEVYLGSSSPLSDEEKTTYSGVLNHLISEASK